MRVVSHTILVIAVVFSWCSTITIMIFEVKIFKALYLFFYCFSVKLKMPPVTANSRQHSAFLGFSVSRHAIWCITKWTGPYGIYPNCLANHNSLLRPRLHGTGLAQSRHQLWSVCEHIYIPLPLILWLVVFKFCNIVTNLRATLTLKVFNLISWPCGSGTV